MEEITKQLNEFKSNCNKQTGKFNISIELMKQKLDNQDKKINQILLKLDGLDEKLESKFASKWVQHVVEGILILFALASLYVIFINAGLPTP